MWKLLIYSNFIYAKKFNISKNNAKNTFKITNENLLKISVNNFIKKKHKFKNIFN